MELARAVNELYVFASEPRVFRFDELLSLLDAKIDSKALRKTLTSKSRFICIHTEVPCEDSYLLDSVFFQWLTRLNLKLAQIKKFRLTEHQFTNTLNHLRRDGRWHTAPRELVRWGQSLGLICRAYTKDYFVFPLARILSFMKSNNKAVMTSLFSDYCENKIWLFSLKKLKRKSLRKGFSNFRDEISYIVRNREAIDTGKKFTLQELGNYFSLTRERIRQLENEFWDTLYFRLRYRAPFFSAFLYDFMDNSGSLIIDINSRKAPLRSFLAKCVGIPQFRFPETNILAIATSKKEIDPLNSSKLISDHISPNFIANRLESQRKVIFSGKDIRKITKEIALYRKSELSKTQKVYLALKSIRKPAHFTTITKVYNSLWPEQIMSDHNVHALLTRQLYGIVWIGLKGIYALKEWGYERPSITLFETVTEIVKRKFRETNAPVHKTIVISEMGKYRKIVTPSSMAIALHCNPELKLVAKDLFIPQKKDEQVQDELSLSDLDKVFKEFEKKNN